MLHRDRGLRERERARGLYVTEHLGLEQEEKRGLFKANEVNEVDAA
jgi:hypothetical protein